MIACKLILGTLRGYWVVVCSRNMCSRGDLNQLSTNEHQGAKDQVASPYDSAAGQHQATGGPR